MSQNMKNFSTAQISEIKSKLSAIPDDKAVVVTGTDYKDPSTMLILSILLGYLGIDRFMLGNVGMGILKLLTWGCCGVLWIIDIINIKKMTWDYNYNKFNESVNI